MKTKNALSFALGISVLVFGYTARVYPALPDLLPIHWNIRGEPDGWAHKQTAVMLMPAIVGVLFLLMFVLPLISKRAFGEESSRRAFNYTMVTVIMLMEFIHMIMLLAGLHPGLDTGKGLMVGMFLFFALLGNMMGKIRRNRWMGVRTKWTLASDKVWEPTHRLAARLMVLGGAAAALLTLIGISPVIGFTLFMALTLYPCYYSYVLYKRLSASGGL